MKTLQFVQDVRSYSPGDTASWPASLQFSVTPLEEVQLKNSAHCSPAANPGTYLTKCLYRPSTRSPLYLITTSQPSGRSCFPASEPSLLMGLITCVISLDASSTLQKRYPQCRLLKSANGPKPGRLMSGLYTRWDNTSIDTYAENRILKLSYLAPGYRTKYRHWLWATVTLLRTSGHIIFWRNTRYYSAVTVDFNINLQLLGSKPICFMILSE